MELIFSFKSRTASLFGANTTREKKHICSSRKPEKSQRKFSSAAFEFEEVETEESV